MHASIFLRHSDVEKVKRPVSTTSMFKAFEHRGSFIAARFARFDSCMELLVGYFIRDNCETDETGHG